MKLTDKVKCEKVFWKELVKGAVLGIIWCSIVFILVLVASDELVIAIEGMAQEPKYILKLYFPVLLFFIVIGIIIKMGVFVCLQAKEEKNRK